MSVAHTKTVFLKRTGALLIATLAALIAGIDLPAQNNAFKIDDECYDIYTRAQRNRTQKIGLAIADSMRTLALRKGDMKAYCISLTIPVVYYYNNEDFDRMESAVRQLKEASRKHNYLQYYYYGGSYQVNGLLKQGNSLRALQLAKENNREAVADNYAYGIATGLRQIGRIYHTRQSYDQALQYFIKSRDYMLAHVPEQDASTTYVSISGCLREAGRYEEALAEIDKAIALSKTGINRTVCLQEKCLVLYGLKRTEEFDKLFDECMELSHRYGTSSTETLLYMKICRALLHGDYATAHSICDSVKNTDRRNMFRRQIYTREGKWFDAYNSLSAQINYKDSIFRNIQASDFAELGVELDNEQMKRQLQERELDLIRANTAALQRDLELSQARAENDSAKAMAGQLELDKRNLEIERISAEARQIREREAARHQQIRQRSLAMYIGMGLLTLLLITLAYVFWARGRTLKKISRKNAELAEARNKAEESDRLKSMFIQNMSHEIRTPLNAIVGFSQLLTMPDSGLEESEKEEFGNLIQQNSDLLTTLINDILSLSELESGKYVMKIDSVEVNKLCRLAISTVAHRKPQNVELNFTTELPDNYVVETDRQRVEQVLINFLTNAEKYTEEGEIRLHVSLSETPGALTFSVSDTGSGIPPEKAPHIFDRFEKLGSFKQGTGLGLNICRTIAEKLGATVKLDTTYTAGARFEFILPLPDLPAN